MDTLATIQSRHSVYLERLKSGYAKNFDPFLQAMAAQIKSMLNAKELTSYTTKQLEKELAKLEKAIDDSYKEYQAVLMANVDELAQYEAGFEVRTLGKVSTASIMTPTAVAISTAVLFEPLQAEGLKGRLLESFYAEWTGKTKAQVSGIIRLGYSQGSSIAEITRQLVGTKQFKYNDGLLGGKKRTTDIMVRTALQHASTISRDRVWQDNTDIAEKYEWVSTLDMRTSSTCRALDGRQWVLGNGPKPPAHVGCRSTVILVLKDKYKKTAEERAASNVGLKVPKGDTYYDWLKTQPHDFVQDVIGTKRATLLLSDKLTVKRFTELQLDRKFEPLTLAEMKLKEPKVFADLGL